MLIHSEFVENLQRAGSVAEAEKLVVGLLEERYGRGAIALEKSALGVRPAQPTRLDKITASMVASGLYPRECAVVINEHFIVESEQRELGDDDVGLLENVTSHFRLTLPRVLQAEGRELLTGLLGPTRFPEELNRLITSQRLLCLLMLDIDRFAEFNAALGSSVGDGAVVKMAQLLGEKTRPNDVVFRLDGDEFAVLLPSTMIEDASRIAQRIREAVELGFAGDHPLTASIGVASWPDRTKDKDELLKAAKDAVYTSWRVGGNRVCACPPPETPSPGDDGGGARVPGDGPDGPVSET